MFPGIPILVYFSLRRAIKEILSQRKERSLQLFCMSYIHISLLLIPDLPPWCKAGAGPDTCGSASKSPGFYSILLSSRSEKTRMDTGFTLSL